MLTIKIPNLCQNEQRYSLDILLGEFLGLAFEVESYEGDVIEITRPGDSDAGSGGDAPNAARLTLDASFFHQAHQAWLKPESMPVLPLATWNPAEEGINANLVEPSVPVLYGQPGLVKNGEHLHINLDIFGSAFFMLSRYEELITKDRDNHDRFPATASVAYRAGFLDRPIVNEYLEILWQCLQQLWPQLLRLKRLPHVEVSCDVDDPFDCLVNQPIALFKTCAMDILKRKDTKLAIKRFMNLLLAPFGINKFDPYNTFDWYMDVCDQSNIKATFYFIIDNSSGKIDGCYSIYDKRIQKLISNIIDRGHKIGVHGSYSTYKNPVQVEKEYLIFQQDILAKFNYKESIGIRQHYLRVDYSQTQDVFNKQGYVYDTTGGYADMPGFRFGVCYEFSMWSWLACQKLSIRQKPLIAMEVAVFNKYSTKQSIIVFKELKELCFQFDGCFSLLWHNSQFYSIRNSIFRSAVGVTNGSR